MTVVVIHGVDVVLGRMLCVKLTLSVEDRLVSKNLSMRCGILSCNWGREFCMISPQSLADSFVKHIVFSFLFSNHSREFMAKTFLSVKIKGLI